MGIWTVSNWKPLARAVSNMCRWMRGSLCPVKPVKRSLPAFFASSSAVAMREAMAGDTIDTIRNSACQLIPRRGVGVGMESCVWCQWCPRIGRIGRLRGNQDVPERQQHQPDGEKAPSDAPDDRRNEGRARQRVRVRAAGPGCEMKQVVADVVERIAAGERGQEHQ